MPINASGVAAGASTGAAIGGPWGALIGAAAGAFLPQAKLQSTTAANVNVAEAQRIGINANADNFNASANLSKMQNDFSANEGRRMMDMTIPGFSQIQAKMLANVNSDLSGSGLDANTSANIQRLAAERGIKRGTSGGFNDFNLLRDFGFNMVDHQNAQRAAAMNTLSSVYNMSPRVNPMTPMASMVSTQQAIGGAQYNETNRYNNDLQFNNMLNKQSADQASQWQGVAQMGGQLAGDWAAGKISSWGKPSLDGGHEQ
jgi:hypothetical protein